jgi:hypothetical protein
MDIATGRANDYTAFSLQDKEGDEYAYFKGKIGIDKAEEIGMKICKRYGRAIFAPESNDVGLGVAINVQNKGYPYLYYSKSLLRKKGQSKPEEVKIPGWYTTKKNRPLIIAELEEDVRNNTCNIRNRFFCDEAYTFIYDSRNRPVAMNKDKESGDEFFDDTIYTDDAIFSEAITNWIRKEKVNRVTVLPR